MADVAPGIITNGLGGSHSNMITGHFHLGFFEGAIIIPPPGGTGGSTVRTPVVYDLRDEDDYPQEQKIEVIIKIRFGQVWRERVYWMLPKDARIVFNIFKFINTTRSRISFAVKGVQNKMKSVIATISNITNKSDKE